jgi:hypothetical protein
MVQRRGSALGGEAAELGRMAGEQEVALRTLVSSGLVPPQRRPQLAPAAVSPAGTVAAADGPDGEVECEEASWAERAVRAVKSAGAGRPGRTPAATVAAMAGDEPCDVRALLAPFAGARVTFSAPGTPVMLPAVAAAESAAAVSAALDNVRVHVGQEARAWILVEGEPDAVVVTVRDDGPGIPEGRLADAEREGRLGVALSIRGRLRDLGGSAKWVSVPGQGTEVELKIPKGPAPEGTSRGKARA